MSVAPFQQTTVPEHQGLGARLKSARVKKSVSLREAEEATKIRLHYLEAIEDDRFDHLPPSHSKGFVRRYAHFVGLSADDIDEELRFLSQPSKRQPFSPQVLERDRRWFVTPRLVATVLSLLVLLGFIGYVSYQVKQFAAPPALEVTKPKNEDVVTSDAFVVEGKTDPGATVTVDHLPATVNSDGTFVYSLTLQPGVNQIAIAAENRIKKQTLKTVAVLYQAPPPTPTPVPSPTPSPSPSPSPTASPKPTAKPSPSASPSPQAT